MFTMFAYSAARFDVGVGTAVGDVLALEALEDEVTVENDVEADEDEDEDDQMLDEDALLQVDELVYALLDDVCEGGGGVDVADGVFDVVDGGGGVDEDVGAGSPPPTLQLPAHVMSL